MWWSACPCSPEAIPTTPATWPPRPASSAICSTTTYRTEVSMALTRRIIPSRDVENGRVVKGVKFYDIRDAGDPVEVARRYNDEGAVEIPFRDNTSSHEGRDTMVHTVE